MGQRFVLIFLGIILSVQTAWASVDTFAGKDEVLIAGDSWGFFLCVYRSFDGVWRKAGAKAKMNPNCLFTTRFGMNADEWLGSSYDQQTKLTLMDNPRIRTLVLSLGGNDLISQSNKNMSPEQELQMHLKIRNYLATIVAIYRKIRPDVRIIISGYDYPRFGNDNKIPQYRKVYKRMGEPTPEELNQVLIRFSHRMLALNDGQNVFYAHHLGLMHYYYGAPEGRLKPGQTLPPDSIGAPDNPMAFGGVMSLRNSDRVMLNVGPLTDAFHLGRTGFHYLAQHLYNLYM